MWQRLDTAVTQEPLLWGGKVWVYNIMNWHTYFVKLDIRQCFHMSLYLSALSSDPIVTKLHLDATPKHYSSVSIREVLLEDKIPNKAQEQVTSHTIMWLL